MKNNNTKLKQLVGKKKKPIEWPGSFSPISQIVQDIESGNYHQFDPTNTLHEIGRRLDAINEKLELVQS